MPTYLIDFDSTFTKVEALDLLANIVLQNDPNQHEIELQIASLTNLAMNGQLSFDLALKQRLALLKIHQRDITELIFQLKNLVSDSFIRNKQFIREHADDIYIISGGFVDFIIPVVTEFGIKNSNVYANEFTFDQDGYVNGYHEENLLSKAKGKVALVESLHLTGEVVVIGDGYTDYEIKEAGLAQTFCLFAENIQRTNLNDKADLIAKNLDEIIANTL